MSSHDGGAGRHREARRGKMAACLRRCVCGQAGSLSCIPLANGLVCVKAAAVVSSFLTAQVDAYTEMRVTTARQTRRKKNMTVAGRAPRRTGGPMTLDDLE